MTLVNIYLFRFIYKNIVNVQKYIKVLNFSKYFFKLTNS